MGQRGGQIDEDCIQVAGEKRIYCDVICEGLCGREGELLTISISFLNVNKIIEFCEHFMKVYGKRSRRQKRDVL